MNQRIYKYPLSLGDYTDVSLPQGAEVLSAHEQDGRIMMWAKVDTELIRVLERRRRIWMIGTGNPIPSGVELRFINTLLFADGALVFHIFEEMQ